MPEQAKPLPPLPRRVHHAVIWGLPAVRLAVFAISVAAAVPTARNLYYSWHEGVPFSQVSHRLAQYAHVHESAQRFHDGAQPWSCPFERGA
jgi:hypothetical protein